MPALSRSFRALLFVLVFAGCAARPGAPVRTDASLQCPKGTTMTCEVRKIGRIHHGTFGNDYDSCSCVSNSMQGQTIPVIP